MTAELCGELERRRDGAVDELAAQRQADRAVLLEVAQPRLELFRRDTHVGDAGRVT